MGGSNRSRKGGVVDSVDGIKCGVGWGGVE